MSTQPENQVGLFHITYNIAQKLAGQPLLGAPHLRLDILVDTVNKTITGVSHIFQSTSPPVNVISQITGEWSYMCTMDSCNILVIADGFDFSSILVGGHPVEHKNVKLRMSLSDDWQSGFANFSYLHAGKWHEVDAATVEIIEYSTQKNIEKLATLTSANKPKVAA